MNRKNHVTKKQDQKKPRKAGTTGKTRQHAAKRAAMAEAFKDPHITLEVDHKAITLDGAMLSDSKKMDQIAKSCESAKLPATFNLTNLSVIPGKERLQVLGFIASLEPGHRFKSKFHPGDTNSISDVVITGLVGDDNLEQFAAAKEAALMTAALFHANDSEGICSRIAKQLFAKGVKGVRTSSLQAEVKKIVKAIEALRQESTKQGQPNQSEPRSVSALFPNAPVAAQLTVPFGWGLTSSGIVRHLDDGSRPVAALPVLISGRSVDPTTANEYVKLVFLRDQNWREQIVSRKVIADRRSIVELSGIGLPVNSNNAGSLIQYLADFEAANITNLKVAHVSSKLGWQANGGNGFLLGHTQISAADTLQPTVTFQGADVGDEQIASGFVRAGTSAAWQAAIKRIKPYPPVMLGLAASFCAPLLCLLQAPNFVLEYAGDTTGGKTTALRIAASVWGNPDETSSTALLHTWDGTRVARERIPAVCQNLPLFLDDTKRAKSREEVTQAIYDVTSGRGRARGSKQGLAQQDAWSTVALSSGEAAATSFSEDGGTRARVLTIWGSPFGTCDPSRAKLAREVNDVVLANFGHAGHRWIEFLVNHQRQWAAFRKRYGHWVSEYEGWAKEGALGNNVAQRMAQPFAALTLTAELVQEAGILTWPNPNPVEPLWADLIREGGEADRASAALADVMSWATGHQGQFFSLGSNSKEPSGGWLGRWDFGSVPSTTEGQDPVEVWDWLGVLPDRLSRILQEYGYEPDPILRTWKDRGYLECSPGRNQLKTRIGKNATWVVAIKRSAIATA